MVFSNLKKGLKKHGKWAAIAIVTGELLSIAAMIGFSSHFDLSRAGEVTRIVSQTDPANEAATGQLVYSFNDCTEPEAPEISLTAKRRQNAAIREYNREVQEFNGYLAKVEVYMDCLTAEADRDLKAYYDAINSSLLERRNHMQGQTDQMRQILGSGPLTKKKSAQQNPENIPTLEGAP